MVCVGEILPGKIYELKRKAQYNKPEYEKQNYTVVVSEDRQVLKC